MILGAAFIPILDVFEQCNVNFALEVHPTEIAFDIGSARRALEAVKQHRRFGFNYDPSHLGYQGVDYVKFIREFKDRIYHWHRRMRGDMVTETLGFLAAHRFRRLPPLLGFPFDRARRHSVRRYHRGIKRHRLLWAVVY